MEPTDPDDEDSRPDDSEDNADPATIAQWILDENEIGDQEGVEQHEANTLKTGA